MTLPRRSLLLAAPALLLPALSHAQQADAVRRVEAYFNALSTLKARFLQVSQTGGSAEGTAWNLAAEPDALRV
jgi:outer membrane lipoprotein-sorting protein